MGWEFIPALFALNTNTKTMRTITFEGKKINFDFSLGCINDVYVKELGGNFNDLVNMEEFKDDHNKLIDITRDMMLSGHIYWLFCNGEDDQAETLISKLKGARMVATKWLVSTTVLTVINWIQEDLMPSDLEVPNTNIKKKK